MNEPLDFLLQTLTYKRYCLELSKQTAEITEILVIDGKIEILTEVITEIYKLV